MDGFGNGLAAFFNSIFVLLIVFFILAVLGVGYALYNWLWKDVEIVSHKKLVPELRLTVTENKVDTLYIYKEQK